MVCVLAQLCKYISLHAGLRIVREIGVQGLEIKRLNSRLLFATVRSCSVAGWLWLIVNGIAPLEICR